MTSGGREGCCQRCGLACGDKERIGCWSYVWQAWVGQWGQVAHLVFRNLRILFFFYIECALRISINIASVLVSSMKINSSYTYVYGEKPSALVAVVHV